MSDLTSLSDEQLAALAKAGDASCETQLLYRYKTTVKQVARGYFLMGGETDDLIQEGMIALYKAIQSYNPDKNAGFKTFAVLCVKRQIIDVIRRAKRDLPVGEVNADSVDFFGSADNMKQRIHSLLSDEESCILDGYLAGLSYGEIAENAGVSAKKVDNELQKIKRIIRNNAENILDYADFY